RGFRRRNNSCHQWHIAQHHWGWTGRHCGCTQLFVVDGDSNLHLSDMPLSNGNASFGETIFANQSSVSFFGNSSFISNSAYYGGAILATYSTLSWNGDGTLFSNNSAGQYGGALTQRIRQCHGMATAPCSPPTPRNMEAQSTLMNRPCLGMVMEPNSARTMLTDLEVQSSHRLVQQCPGMATAPSSAPTPRIMGVQLTRGIPQCHGMATASSSALTRLILEAQSTRLNQPCLGMATEPNSCPAPRTMEEVMEGQSSHRLIRPCHGMGTALSSAPTPLVLEVQST
ncbi:unnamed protein product, partial [Ectocarpus fasciculatus]